MPFNEQAADKDVQAYKFGGKEYDTMHGLDQLDYHARQYDPTTGRFNTIDPMAEKFYNWSPYVYCANNPLINVDPTGEIDWDALKNRGLGALQTLGGVAQIIVGGTALAAPEPTMATKVIGGIAVAHGADDIVAGAKQMWSGESNNTLTHTAIAESSKALGANDVTANNIATLGDAAIGITSTASSANSLGKGVNAASSVNNPVPNKLARVIPAGVNSKTLGAPGASDVFVTGLQI